MKKTLLLLTTLLALGVQADFDSDLRGGESDHFGNEEEYEECGTHEEHENDVISISAPTAAKAWWKNPGKLIAEGAGVVGDVLDKVTGAD